MNKRIPLAAFLGLSALMVSIGWARDAVPKPATPVAGAEARDPQKASPDEIRSWFSQLDGTHRLPITGLTLAQSGDKLLLISDNGRFAVVGNFRLLDVWNAQEIKSLQDADRLDRLDLKKIGIKDGDLARLKLGTGAETVTVFVDPLCPHCHHLIQQMDALKKDYTFDLVISPVLGEKSADISRKLWCQPDRGKALNALLKQEYDTLPAVPRDTKSCDLAPLQKSIVTTRLLGIDGVPYMILPSKSVRKGGVDDLKTLLEKDREKLVSR